MEPDDAMSGREADEVGCLMVGYLSKLDHML